MESRYLRLHIHISQLLEIYVYVIKKLSSRHGSLSLPTFPYFTIEHFGPIGTEHSFDRQRILVVNSEVWYQSTELLPFQHLNPMYS